MVFNLADEVFIPGENNDEDEICRQGYVDHVEHADNEVVPRQGRQVNCQSIKIREKSVDQQKKAKHKTDEERRQQPPREENRRLKAALDLPHGIPVKASTASTFPSMRTPGQ